MAIGRIPEPLAGIQESIIAAKGDLIAGTANDQAGILSVGTNGHTLVADSATATGLKWAAPAGGGMTVISTGTLTSSGVTFSSIPGTYNNLQLSISGYNAGGGRLTLRINGDTGSNYVGAWLRNNNGTFGNAAYTPQTQIYSDGEVTPDNGATNTVVFNIPEYAATTGKKVLTSVSYVLASNYVPSFNFWAYTGTTAAITSLTIIATSASAGTYTLYGVK